MTPSSAFRWQSSSAIVLACAVALASIVFSRLDSRLELLIVLTIIFFFGIPHGALDTVLARQVYAIRNFSGWLVFSLAYLVIAAAVVGLWWLLPVVFLTGFLLISAFHFSGDLAAPTPPSVRFWYGGSIIILPALLHEHEIGVLFGYLIAGDFPSKLASLLHILAMPWLIGLTISCIMRLRREAMTSLETMSMGLLALVAPPLIGFTVFFCAMHSARHTIRTQNFAGEMGLWWVVKQAVLPMFAVAMIAAVLWPAFEKIPFDAAAVQFLFVSLAALTVPHMWLIERARALRAFPMV